MNKKRRRNYKNCTNGLFRRNKKRDVMRRARFILLAFSEFAQNIQKSLLLNLLVAFAVERVSYPIGGEFN